MMQFISIANPKGGVGKSTVATNLAGLLAVQGHTVMLGDADRQQSSAQWVALRPPNAARIQTWEVDAKDIARPPKGTTHIVLDTPAGLHGTKLDQVIEHSTHMLVPLAPSMFDIMATQVFLKELVEHSAVRKGRCKVAVVGMRVDIRTRAAEQLVRFCEQSGVPVLGYLRNTQNYVQLAAHGLTLFDVAPSRVERDIADWQAIIEWLK